MAKKKFYVVWKGHKTGIFTTWDECSAQVSGYSGAAYKSFESRAVAEKAFHSRYEEYEGKPASNANPRRPIDVGPPIQDSYAVDASCLGNPGALEYRCVHVTTGEEIFHQGPFEYGTNNVGEFLAIVHALAFFKKKGITLPIYSDSRNAITWLKGKKCKTNLEKTEKNSALFALIERAEAWLANNEYPNQIYKWATDVWGEIPADYGRK